MIPITASGKLYIPYACHYNPRFVCFKPTFWETFFQGLISENPLFMCGFYSRAGYDGARTVFDFKYITLNCLIFRENLGLWETKFWIQGLYWANEKTIQISEKWRACSAKQNYAPKTTKISANQSFLIISNCPHAEVAFSTGSCDTIYIHNLLK